LSQKSLVLVEVNKKDASIIKITSEIDFGTQFSLWVCIFFSSFSKGWKKLYGFSESKDFVCLVGCLLSCFMSSLFQKKNWIRVWLGLQRKREH